MVETPMKKNSLGNLLPESQWKIFHHWEIGGQIPNGKYLVGKRQAVVGTKRVLLGLSHFSRVFEIFN